MIKKEESRWRRIEGRKHERAKKAILRLAEGGEKGNGKGEESSEGQKM